MDRNQATGLLLISVLLIAYLLFLAPKGPKTPTTPDGKPAAAAVTRQPANELATPPLPADSAARASALGAFAAARRRRFRSGRDAGKPEPARAAGHPRRLPRAVRLKNYKTWDQQPLDLLKAQTGALDVTLPVAGGKPVQLSQLQFSTEGPRAVKTASGLDAQQVVFTASLGGDRAVEQIYTLPADAFAFEYNLRLRNLGGDAGQPAGAAHLARQPDAYRARLHPEPARRYRQLLHQGR